MARKCLLKNEPIDILLSMSIYVQAANQISMQEPLCEAWMENPVEHQEPFCRSIEPDYKPYVSPVEGRRMGKLLKRALATSKKTLDDCGLTSPEAIITGTGLGSVESTEAFLLDMCQNGEELLKPTHFMQSTHNTIGSLVAIQTKCHGYNATYSHKQICFESALYDAWLQLEQKTLNNALVLGQDATTENYYHLLELIDYVGNGMKGTCGEASVAALLSNNELPGHQPLCELVSVKLLHRPTLEQWKKVVEGLHLPSDCVLLAGYNGHPKNDALYDELLPILFPNAQVLTYKQWFGECYSASALGFYVAAQWIARGQQKHVLVVTLDRMGDAAMTYLRKI